MEPITASTTTTKINTQQIYPQPKSNKKVRIVVDSSNGSDEVEGANSGIERLEGNEVLAESGDISSAEENEEEPFLLVSLRASKKAPSRPKNVSYLYMIALLDLSIITAFTILLVHKDKKGHWHWRKAAWDWIALGLIRFIVVVVIASSPWIRQLRWILGGVCCFSSLYIIFKANLIFQYRKQIDKYRLILLISSFLFCQIHWIAYVVVTTDSRRKARFLRDQSIIFEEESRRNSYADENNNEDAISNNIHRNTPSHPTLRSYNATENRNDEMRI